MSDGADRLRGRDIIYEWLDYGDVVRVNVVDVATGIEDFATGPRATDRSDLERLALRKLARRLFDHPHGADDRGSGGAGEQGDEPPPAGSRRGKLI